MSIKTALKNLRDARKEYQKQLKDVGKTAAKGIAEQIAEFLPPGWTLVWTQYTPYFNDGDACTFSVHDAYLVKEDKERESKYAEEDGIYIGTAIERYGTPDVEKSYESTDYSQKKWNGMSYEYGKKTVAYTEYGFPEIEGYSVKTLEKLGKLWAELSAEEDLMETAFGDHVEVVVHANGKFDADEYSHD